VCCIATQGPLLAIGCKDGSVTLTTPQTVSTGSESGSGGALARSLSGHRAKVTSVAFSAPQASGHTLLATTSFDKTIRLWNVGTGEPVSPCELLPCACSFSNVIRVANTPPLLSPMVRRSKWIP
jgi:WD40 repeat protein